MTTPTSPDIAQRLARLEADHKRHQIAIILLSVLVLIFAVVVPFTRRTVAARQFVLTAGGQARAAWTTTADGTPLFSLLDTRGRERLTLSMRGNGSPDITLADSAGRIRSALRVTEGGVPYLFFTDQAGAIRAALGVPADGLPSLVLLGDGERVRYMTP